MLPVNAVSERLEGKPHEPFDGGELETEQAHRLRDVPPRGTVGLPSPAGRPPRQLLPSTACRFDRGRWRHGSHGEPEGCTHRETGEIEPGRLQLADQPAAYLTGMTAAASAANPTRRLSLNGTGWHKWDYVCFTNCGLRPAVVPRHELTARLQGDYKRSPFHETAGGVCGPQIG
jgi:hypothetical protein